MYMHALAYIIIVIGMIDRDLKKHTDAKRPSNPNNNSCRREGGKGGRGGRGHKAI